MVTHKQAKAAAHQANTEDCALGNLAAISGVSQNFTSPVKFCETPEMVGTNYGFIFPITPEDFDT